MQTFLTRVVPAAVFFVSVWVGLGALDRIQSKYDRLCPDGAVFGCASIAEERQFLTFAVIIAAAALAWASVRFNTAAKRS